MDGMRDPAQFYEQLMSVDPRNIQFAIHSFTFLNWRLIEQICNEEINIPDLNLSEVEKMFYNILPGGETILHRLCEKE